MTITAKTSTIRNALSNALAALAQAKPGASFTATPTPSGCTLEGTKIVPFPLALTGPAEADALCAMLNITLSSDQRPLGETRAQLDSAQQEIASLRQSLQAAKERLEVSQRHLDEQARATVAIVEEDQRKLTHLQGEVASARSEIKALSKSLEGVARQPQRAPVAQPAPAILAASPVPVSVAAGRSLLDEIAAATVGETWTMVEPGPEQLAPAPVAAPAIESKPVTITFPANEQGRTLAKARQNLQSLKAAGFVFKFTDRKDTSKGGRWEAPNTHDARQLASLISAYLVNV
jgi:hypothetical protein